MARSRLLLADGIINLLLGALLLITPQFLEQQLGMPTNASGFYGSILGAVLFGIGIALIWERYRKRGHAPGLGLAGAISINIAGGLVLIFWLLSGRLVTPPLGQILLWLLAAVLLAISLMETLAEIRNR